MSAILDLVSSFGIEGSSLAACTQIKRAQHNKAFEVSGFERDKHVRLILFLSPLGVGLVLVVQFNMFILTFDLDFVLIIQLVESLCLL
ncbi:hypothetical protein HanPI659440_Chr09g0351591 [Helianthus annuus]|nr:hypothetical protein HanHA300_Chr09g0334561 [Helianthus annuus]KAJ0536222.1 hypothetical protein HanIR_Chr09g0439161 [Helianthus annuus]KAJ0543901.1 hypothetical protein HanHA89_Chr09g0355631 [Helianthus annuus]KAJ0708955.1 hypothetical protein HanLR1_Chr09g0334941 [Helianthus annuus]KAJ0754871.1 hypothetical protein HanPI659440_Chr09g0351591 [Helianthus annuus]